MHNTHLQLPNEEREADRCCIASSTFEKSGKSKDQKACVLAQIVAQAHGVTVAELFHHSRSRAPIAATRQLAMYLMHVTLGRTLTAVGDFYRRDRTTVSHACRCVEDMRDDPLFDEKVCEFEARIEFVTADPKLIERYLAGVPLDA